VTGEGVVEMGRRKEKDSEDEERIKKEQVQLEGERSNGGEQRSVTSQEHQMSRFTHFRPMMSTSQSYSSSPSPPSSSSSSSPSASPSPSPSSLPADEAQWLVAVNQEFPPASAKKTT